MNALFSSYMRRLNVRHAYLPAFLVLGSVSFPGAAEAQWSPYNSTGFYSNENDNYSEDGNYTVTWWMNTYGSWNAVQIISGDLSNRKNSTGSWTSIGNAGYANVGANSWYQYDKNETGLFRFLCQRKVA